MVLKIILKMEAQEQQLWQQNQAKHEAHAHVVSTSSIPFSFFVLNVQSKGVQKLPSPVLPAPHMPFFCFPLKSHLPTRDFVSFPVLRVGTLVVCE